MDTEREEQGIFNGLCSGLYMFMPIHGNASERGGAEDQGFRHCFWPYIFLD